MGGIAGRSSESRDELGKPPKHGQTNGGREGLVLCGEGGMASHVRALRRRGGAGWEEGSGMGLVEFI